MRKRPLVRALMLVLVSGGTAPTWALDQRPWAKDPSPADTQGQPAASPSGAAAAPQSVPESAPTTPPQFQAVYPQPYIYIPPPAPPRKDRMEWVEQEVMNMTPEEIRAFKEEYRKRQAAAYDKPPELRTSTVPVSLEPGAEFPSVHVAPGHVSSLVFLDAGGDPWPVKGVSWGDKDTFRIEPPPESDKSAPQNIVAVSVAREIGATSMSVLLEGKAVPVVIRLKADRKISDARVDLRLNEYGPKSDPMNRAVAASIPAQAGDTVMTAFLDGVPPKGARELKVEGGPMRAWMFGDQMYVRTVANLMSPAWDAVEHGAGGVRVYRMGQAPVVLFAYNGGTNMARIVDGGMPQ